MVTLEEWGDDIRRRQLASLADAPFAETYGDVQFGHPFRARCANDVEHDDFTCTPCSGTLWFASMDPAAPCDTCGARCGRLVAHWPR